MSAHSDDERNSAIETGGTRFFSRDRLIPIVIASALFMDLMDTASLALALPTISRDFGISTTDLRLALTIYAVTVAVLVPASAWMAGRFGARRVFITAMIVFVLGSISCGLSNSLQQLVMSRVLQGAGGAMMTPVGRAIMVGAIDRGAMVRAMAWYTLPAIIAPLMGPPIAGLLIEIVSWRWIFFINVPVGILGIAAVMRFVPRLDREEPRVFDVLGFVLCGGTILAALGVLETGMLHGQPAAIRVLAVAAVVALATVYCRQALRSSHPLVNLRVLRHRSLAFSLSACGLQRVAIGAITVMLPLQLQVALGLSPPAASQVPAIGAIGSILSRFFCPLALRAAGFRTVMVASALILSIATFVPIWFQPGTPLIFMCAFMACYALIRATFFMSGNSLSYADVEGPEIGHSSVLFSISQQLTLGLGYSLGGGIIAGAGGAGDISAYVMGYSLVALLPLGAALIIARLPAHVGEELRQGAAP